MIIKTERLIIRPFEKRDDESTIRRVLGQSSRHSTSETPPLANLQSWLQWQMLNDEWYPKMVQPPYGDRAVTLKGNGQLIGMVGYVPCLAPFAQMPELNEIRSTTEGFTPELALFYAVDPEHQRRGYATEATRAMIEYAFNQLHIDRVVAMTDYTNTASQKVMQKLGMTIARNTTNQPHWLQVVGVLHNQRAADQDPSKSPPLP